MKLASPLYSLKAWRTIGSEACSRVYGVEGSGVFRREHNYTQLEKYYVPFNPQTASQQANRSMFAYAVSDWKALPQNSKLRWNHEQDYHRQRPIMSGYNLYISRYLNLEAPPADPPVCDKHKLPFSYS